MKRPEFITLLGGATVSWPLATRAQQSERMRRVGILMPFSPNDREFQDRVHAFKEELQNRGWTAGLNVQFDNVGPPTIWI
jgi:putative ABC transport system substrate-binding protein